MPCNKEFISWIHHKSELLILPENSCLQDAENQTRRLVTASAILLSDFLINSY
jgi:hypothetical protein